MITALLIDTDVGTDAGDALAIGLALSSPDLDVCAVTTVAGRTVQRARIAKKLLVLGRRPEIPVAAGMQEPLLRRSAFTWRGDEGRRIVKEREELELAPINAVDLLIELALRERPHVAAIGPLTNLAEAITKEPEVKRSIAQLIVADANFDADPEATMLVLTAGIPTTLLPVAVTRRAVFRHADRARLRWARAPLARTLGRDVDACAAALPADRDPDLAAFLDDALAVAVVLDRSLVTFESRRLRPTLTGARVELVADPEADALDVAVAVDAPRATAFVLDQLLSLR